MLLLCTDYRLFILLSSFLSFTDMADTPSYRYGVFERARELGLSLDDVSHLLSISKRTAVRWNRQEPQTAGRPTETLRREQRMKLVSSLARRKRSKGGKVQPVNPSAPRIRTALLREHSIKVTSRTVLRDLDELGFRYKVRPKHPNLRNAARRLAFSKHWARQPADFLIFSDEHYISTNDHSSRAMHCPPGTDAIPRERQRRQNVPNFQLWAAIGVGWRSKLVFFPKHNKDDDSSQPGGFRMNSRNYIDRCLSTISSHLKSGPYVFMQDGARCHWSKDVLGYFERQNIKIMRDFPSCSPDLNPIEMMWAELNGRIAEFMPENDDELKKAAIRAWSEIPQSVIDNHVLSFRSKCRKTIKNGGK